MVKRGAKADADAVLFSPAPGMHLVGDLRGNKGCCLQCFEEPALKYLH